MRVCLQTALAEVASLPVPNPKIAILNACCSGKLTAHGRIFDDSIWRGSEDIVPVQVWQELSRLQKRAEIAWTAGESLPVKESQCDWMNGNIQLSWPTERGPTILNVSDIWFLRTELDNYFRAPADVATEVETAFTEQPSHTAEEQSNKGGRPPAPHGQVISAVALRLAALSLEQQGRSTTESVAADLSVEYARLGSTVNPQSLRKHAQGLLRALRSVQQSSPEC